MTQNSVKHYPKLTQNAHVQTLIVGGGLSGLTTAYYLSMATDDLMVIEADQIGCGTSGRNSGKVTIQHGCIYHKLIKQHGFETAKAYYQAQKEALESIAAVIEEHHIQCHAKRKAAILYTNDDTKIAQIQDEFQAYLDLGIPCEYLEKQDAPLPWKAALRIQDQLGYDPYAYLLGLSDCLDEKNISIYEHSCAQAVEKDGNGWRVSVNNHYVYAQNIVSATMTPLVDAFSFFYAKSYPSVSHIAIMPCAHSLQNEMCYSIDDPMASYHDINENNLLCGGYEHPAAEAEAERLDAWIAELQKTWHAQRAISLWNSQDLMSFDHLPLIGPLSKRYPNLLIACGYSKWGNTNANAAGKLLCSILLKQENPYASLFHPSRIKSFLKPQCFHMNIKTAFAFIKSQFPDIKNISCQKNEGKVVTIKGRLYGMYRDENDEIYLIDIRCPHLGCICTFNSIDHTWDCPCHGSRFSYDGSIIKGPAQEALSDHHDRDNNHVDPHEFIKKAD